MKDFRPGLQIRFIDMGYFGLVRSAECLENPGRFKSPGQLLQQLADGTCISKLENRVDTFIGLYVASAGSTGHQPLLDATLQLDTASSIQWRANAGSGREKT